jgi:hypothetical protein
MGQLSLLPIEEKDMHALSYELRFRSLFHQGRGFAFPCDDSGHVDMDTLSDNERCSYFHARAVVGRELGQPVVRPSAAH